MQSGLIAVELVCRLNQIPVDTRAIIRQYGLNEEELQTPELLRILKKQGFKAKLKKLTLNKLAKHYPLPAIAKSDMGQYTVILKIDTAEETLLLFSMEDKNTKEICFADFDISFTNQFVVLSPKMLSEQIKFGFKWFYKEILQFKRIIAEVLLSSFVVQLFGLVTPLFTQVILDKVVVHHSLTTLDVLAVAFLATMLFEFLLNLSRNYVFTHTASKIDAKLGAKLFQHLLQLPYVYFESRKVGNIVARIRELDNIRDFITNKSVSVVLDTIFSVVFLGMMMLYSVPLSLMVLGFIAVIGILYASITPTFRDRLENKFQMGAQSNSYLVETVTGIQTVKALAVEGSLQRKWEDYLGNYLNSGFRLRTLGNVAQGLSNLLQRLMTLAILFFGVKAVIENKMTIGQLIAFQMFSNQLTSPVLRLVNLWHEFQQTLLAVDRLGDILNHPIEIQSQQAITLPQVQGAIRVENLVFRYQPNMPNVLDKVSLAIQPGMHVGIVGRSGSGKSTITKLVQRLYLPQEGAIYLDDVDIRHLNPVWLRYQIGVVLQESYLFSGTIRENIALPKPDSPIELIIHAAKMAGAHSFISELPEGYDTIVGERGSTLSGGQKQRIAIARALITNPRIIILDEATSALDYESERIIQNNLEQIRKGRTVITIAHRLSMVSGCDLIVAMDKGNIIEMGTHSELMVKHGYYYGLVQQQEMMAKAPVVVTANSIIDAKQGKSDNVGVS